MDPEMTILSEVSQTEKDKCRHLYVILTYDTDELTYENKQTHREQNHGCQGGVGW